MAQQTAMQELVKWMEDSSMVIPFDQEYCYNKAIELLQKEEEQMRDSFENGLRSDYCSDFNQWYEETFKK